MTNLFYRYLPSIIKFALWVILGWNICASAYRAGHKSGVEQATKECKEIVREIYAIKAQ